MRPQIYEGQETYCHNLLTGSFLEIKNGMGEPYRPHNISNTISTKL